MFVQTPLNKRQISQNDARMNTQTKFNQLRLVHRPFSNVSGPKSMSENNNKQMINIPQPKRGKKTKEQIKKQITSVFQPSKTHNITKEELEKKIQAKKYQETKNRDNQLRKEGKFGFKDNRPISNQPHLGNTNFKSTGKHFKKDKVGENLEYFLAESCLGKGQKLEQPMKTVYLWQNKEIERFVEDPNLGDFIIKLPNPDSLGAQHLDLYPQANNQDKQVLTNYDQAKSFYMDMFDVGKQSHRRIQNQKNSFMIAYYLLDFEQNFNQTKIDFEGQLKKEDYTQEEALTTIQLLEKQVQVFLLVFQYFTEIQKLKFDQIVLKIKTLMDNLFKALNIYQELDNRYNMLAPVFGTLLVEGQSKQRRQLQFGLNMQILIKQAKKKFFSKQSSFNEHKKTIFEKFLADYVKTNANNLVNLSEFGYDVNMIKLRSKYIFLMIFKNIQKISTFFTYFMAYGGANYTNFIEKQFKTKGSVRKLFKGKHLQKIPQGDNMLWVNNKRMPTDLYTLLRNCLIYQLTQNCLFRVRSFLSKNQNQIVLVVKASEEVLQYYAQKNLISMEVEIGATDLFSFEPVDKYQRPLRLHKYIRDQSFINKYSLRSNKLDKDQETSEKSIQSQALNMYKKAEKMNADQLRVKIILDQEETDDSFRWITNKLKIKFIDDKHNLTNEKNNEKIDRKTWQCYYVYNKLVTAFIKRVKKMFQTKNQGVENQKILKELNKNLGFILRIMFIKAVDTCNQFFYKNRQEKGALPNGVKNIFTSKKKLVNFWDKMQVREPSGYFHYIKNKSFERIWRKYEVNQVKERSKFFPAQRIYIANKIIERSVNVHKSIQKKHILTYFPLHDPFILKNIKIKPYLLNLKTKITNISKEAQPNISNAVQNMFILYESKSTVSDFTKNSVEDKLSMSNSLFNHFSIETVRFYCGEKIAFYFDFIKYLTKKAYPFIIPAFIIQIFLWVEQTQILKTGQSNLRHFNSALIFIVTLFNMYWTTNCVQQWKWEEKSTAERFGVTQLNQNTQKRINFNGKYRRNFQTDDLNDEYVHRSTTILKSIFTFVINLLYVILVSLVILQIFMLKSVMFQLGYSQSTVNNIPSILIAIVVQIFNYLYIYLINLITEFENHKTISDFQRSLISKSYIVTFVITFISIFIYAFFSSYLDYDFLCIIQTTQTQDQIRDCDYFVSSQLLSLVMVDLIFSIISAVWPYAKFKIEQYRQSKKEKPKTKFFYNKFEAIDEFYEEQDKMQSYMFNQEIDNSWIGYMNLINVFTALALFGPALPFIYVMMFVSGVVRLHASKYQVIFLTKRSIPVKANSINWWLTIIQIISVLSIFCNIAYMIYTREVFPQNKPQIFFFFILVFFILKVYLLYHYDSKSNSMGERNSKKVTELVLRKSDQNNANLEQSIDTDVLNVYYDESRLKRTAPKLNKANVRFTKDKYVQSTGRFQQTLGYRQTE